MNDSATITFVIISMRVWIVTFFLLFSLVEFYQWIKQFQVPMPLYVLAGAFLAMASNNDLGIASFFGGKTKVTSVVLEAQKPQENLPHPSTPSSQ